jgi:hypothetical protein
MSPLAVALFCSDNIGSEFTEENNGGLHLEKETRIVVVF